MRDLTIHDQTIIAQCTPQGPGALALLRITGAQALEIASRISELASKQSLLSVPTHTIHYGYIKSGYIKCGHIQNTSNTLALEQGARTGAGDKAAHANKASKIDNVLFLVMHGPRTFTGQDTVEITCHNNPFIIEQIIEAAILAGARHAQNGEFTRRAVQNNKLDIIQAESINELIHANTQMSLKQALAQVNGSFSHWIQVLEKNILKALAFCEASFEFLDEEMTFDHQVKALLEETLDAIAQVKITFDKQQQIRQGIRIAIIGSVNVGKSSIFNALLHQKRAIVTNIAGTTRDTIEAGLYKNGNYWTLIDTAGLRETDDVIEQEGITRSFEQAQLADIILLVFDGSRELTQRESDVYTQITQKYSEKIIHVRNKADLPLANTGHENSSSSIPISAQANTGIDNLERAIEQKILAIFSSVQSPFLLNKRHHNILLDLEKDLTHILSFFVGTVHYELIACHLNDALAHLSDLTGKTISEQTMDAIFKEFCVGK